MSYMYYNNWNKSKCNPHYGSCNPCNPCNPCNCECECVIKCPTSPTGPIGPTGPTGPGAITAFGSVNNSSNQEVFVPAGGTYTPILDSTTAANNVGTTPTGITIQQAGLYRVGYNTSLSISNNPSFVQMFATLNGANIASTLAAANTQPSDVTNPASSTLICLPAGSQLGLSATTGSQGDLFIPANGAVLEAIRVGDC